MGEIAKLREAATKTKFLYMKSHGFQPRVADDNDDNDRPATGDGEQEVAEESKNEMEYVSSREVEKFVGAAKIAGEMKRVKNILSSLNIILF